MFYIHVFLFYFSKVSCLMHHFSAKIWSTILVVNYSQIYMFNVGTQFYRIFQVVFPNAVEVRLSISYYLIKSAFFFKFSYIWIFISRSLHQTKSRQCVRHFVISQLWASRAVNVYLTIPAVIMYRKTKW